MRRKPFGDAGQSGALRKEFLGFLDVRVLYQDAPVRKLEVKFFHLSGDKQGQLVATSGPRGTNEDGSYFAPFPVPLGLYRCEIEGQPPTIVSTVEELGLPFVIHLPIGRPYFDLDLPEPPPTEARKQPPLGLRADPRGTLVVRVLFLDEPVAGLAVTFCLHDGTTLGATTTDADGRAALGRPVEPGLYWCRLVGQPDAEITTVEDPSRPFTLVLPVHRPYFDLMLAEPAPHDVADEAVQMIPRPVEPPADTSMAPPRVEPPREHRSRERAGWSRHRADPPAQRPERDQTTAGPVPRPQGMLRIQVMMGQRAWTRGAVDVVVAGARQRLSTGPDGVAMLPDPVPSGRYRCIVDPDGPEPHKFTVPTVRRPSSRPVVLQLLK